MQGILNSSSNELENRIWTLAQCLNISIIPLIYSRNTFFLMWQFILNISTKTCHLCLIFKKNLTDPLHRHMLMCETKIAFKKIHSWLCIGFQRSKPWQICQIWIWMKLLIRIIACMLPRCTVAFSHAFYLIADIFLF